MRTRRREHIPGFKTRTDGEMTIRVGIWTELSTNARDASRPLLYSVSGGLLVAQSILSPSVTRTCGRPRASSKTKAEIQ